MTAAILQTSAPKRKKKKKAVQVHCRQTIVLEDDTVQVPEWVVDLSSFRQWAGTDGFPEKLPRVCYLAGEVWIDMSHEQLFTHNHLKQRYYQVLGPLADLLRGRFCPDGMIIVNEKADLCCKPDGTFYFNESLKKGIVRLVQGAETGYIELEGSPDMVLEVVSQSSVKKDLDILFQLYHQAGVREYWLVDVRKELRFDIYRQTEKGYKAARKTKGWIKSHVFGKSFQLTQEEDELGHPVYTLLVK